MCTSAVAQISANEALLPRQDYQLKHSPKSVYLKVDESINWRAINGVIVRGLNHLLLIFITFLAFIFASRAGINVGVIASLFTSGVFFTSVAFYFVYGETLTRTDFSSMVFIVIGTCMIGFGTPSRKAGAEEGLTSGEDNFAVTEAGDTTLEKWLAITFAITSGLCFAVNSFVMKYYVDKIGFTPL